MPTVDLYNIEGQKVGDLQLAETVFAVEVNEDVLHQVVVAQLANKRQGNQSAKTRAEVSGGGKKPWRQKGTGRARQGSIRAPQWIHGGVVFAPKPRDYKMSIPKSMRRVAMKSALTSKVNENELVVLESLELDAPKTKEMVKMINAFEGKKPLIVVPESNEVIYKSVRNIEGATVVPVNNINVYDILKHDKFIITKEAVSKIEEVYA
ncbi:MULTISPECIES: 50S ribosomal protein L4 [Clostridium]|uniref:Large ribosomal subunit protein uL4 n=1 Tax=Clostridium novyi (strain NT) TaxID=386415 RepID=RL4_CLONN|nr:MULTISPECIES: 50S ribosomal protein L4 [Clostridium]A0PXU7.1 RecName: Full=Large ribosomal subunit protein uL4; AltName: Full=50S ribosomal protein L4 [Clostridium novyi NT]ABK61736.1 ribosomal protein L4/L1 family [Clostridium novyi NT]KEH87333.1 50S ribosomal protein L4 [Clostridium novyi A str. NCTC 538]KEH90209.1 50S ribosomal protein L4 [Clostridium novyi A str. 4540]KEH90726.1 50S ribosomal protein L4 [Clostridium novyi A str. BKT29909]KEH92112.1 50S ribosomal protein L4 [Clostridium